MDEKKGKKKKSYLNDFNFVGNRLCCAPIEGIIPEEEDHSLALQFEGSLNNLCTTRNSCKLFNSFDIEVFGEFHITGRSSDKQHAEPQIPLLGGKFIVNHSIWPLYNDRQFPRSLNQNISRFVGEVLVGCLVSTIKSKGSRSNL